MIYLQNGECVKKSTKYASKTMSLALNQGNLFEFRKVAVVEDFYDIIRAVHVDKYGNHVGQKQTYKIVSKLFLSVLFTGCRQVISFGLTFAIIERSFRRAPCNSQIYIQNSQFAK